MHVTGASIQGLSFSASSALLPAENDASEKRKSPACRPHRQRFRSAVSLATKINRFEFQNFDTVQPATQSSLAIDASINEYTDLLVGGWFNQAGDHLSFDLNTTLENL